MNDSFNKKLYPNLELISFHEKCVRPEIEVISCMDDITYLKAKVKPIKCHLLVVKEPSAERFFIASSVHLSAYSW